MNEFFRLPFSRVANSVIGSILTMLLIFGGVTDVHAYDDKVRSSGDTGRRIVEVGQAHEPGSIIVSLTDRRLYHVLRRGRAVSYPVATPRREDMWIGNEPVTRKQTDPPWRPTPTMLRENPRLPSYVPGGHRYNPMGARALYLGNTYYRIHGTDAPWLIGQNVSKGCIRMHNEDVIELFDRVRVGTRVSVVEESISRDVAQTVRKPRAARQSNVES